MAVIINELEVVTETPPEAAGAAQDDTQAAAQPAGAAPPRPGDVEAILRFQAERASRLYAG